MSKRKKVLSVALGTFVGGGIASLLGVWWGKGLMGPPCQVAVFVKVLAAIGAIIGGIWGVLFRAFSDNVVGVTVGLVVWAAAIAFLFLPALLCASMQPCPSPRPYPGLLTDRIWPYFGEAYVGSGWHYRSEIYTVTLSMADLQQYYTGEMDRYCEGSWQFENSVDPEYVHCLEAFCDIRIGADPQFFWVYLCPVDEGQIRVVQEDRWEFD